jgi:hypothetical protein
MTFYILQRVEPLPGSDLEANNKTIFAASQHIFNKYTRPLLGDAFAGRHFPMEMIESRMEQLCFLCGPFRGVISERTLELRAQLKVGLGVSQLKQ